MNDNYDQSQDHWGLLATGSSRDWSVDVDEALDREEWSLEIEGPQTYLVFQLHDLPVISKALHFLQSGSFTKCRTSGPDESEENTLDLGRFGSSSVSLLRDDEGFPR